MKKFLLSACAVSMVAFMGMAQQTVPAAGVINMDEYPSGIGSIELVGSYNVNPECTAFAQLYQNGVLLRQVPAYAAGDEVFTTTGYDKSTQIPGLVGDLHITFFRDQVSPAAEFGSYKVIIPEGFGYAVSGGQKTLTPRIEREFFVKQPSLTFFPTRGSSVETIQTIYVTLPEQATNVTVNKVTTNASYNYVDENDAEKSISYSFSGYGYLSLPEESPNGESTDRTTLNSISAKVTGRVVEITFPETSGMNGRATFTIPAGVISFQVADGDLKGSYKNSEAAMTLDMTSAVASGVPTIAPAPGKYEGGITAHLDLAQTAGNKSWYNIFNITVPESTGGVKNVLMAKPVAYKINEDGTRGASTMLFAQKTGDYTVGIVFYNLSDRTAPNVFFPGVGKYEIVFPANQIYYQNGAKNTELSFGPFEFTAAEGGDDNFVITPSTTTKIDGIQDIEITFPEGSELVWNVSNAASLSNEYSVIYLKPTNVTTENAGPQMFKVDGNSVKFELPVELKYAGEWAFSLPANTLRVDGEYANINKTFTIKTPEIASLEVVSDIKNSEITSEWDEDRDTYVYTCVAHTLEDEATFTFDIPNGFTNMYYMRYDVMQNDVPAYRRIPVSTAIAAGMTEGNTITIENGDKNVGYEIAFAIGDDIPEYARYMAIFTVDENTEVTGVELIKANELVDVYSVTGARVASKVDARILNQLPAGLYIINGKKVLVK